MKKVETPAWLKTSALLLLIAQNVSLVLTMKVSMGNGAAPYIVTVAVLLTELLKLCICLVVIYFYIQKPFDWGSVWSAEGLKMAVPALLYVVQNNMLYFALSRLEPAVFQITYQLKIATTAMFSVLMLKRTLSRAQWVGVGLLLPGVCLVQLSRLSGAAVVEPSVAAVLLAPAAAGGSGSSNSSSSSAGGVGGGADGSGFHTWDHVHHSSNHPLATAGHQPDQAVSFIEQIIGFVAVLLSCVTSGFAGVYFEKVLKSAQSLSLWERNIQLAVYSIVIASISVVTKDLGRVMDEGPLVGMSVSSWVVVLLQAAGGLVIAVVVRYTDNIAKAFATSVSVIISCTLSIFFFNFHPPLIFFLGASLVGLAVRFYSAKEKDWLVHFILVQMLGWKEINGTQFVLPK